MDAQRLTGANFCTSSSLLTATGAETVHDTTVALTFCINGKALVKSATNADAVTPTTDYNTGAVFPGLNVNQGTVVVWGYTATLDNAASASVDAKCMMGSIEDLDSAGNFKNRPQFPPVPDTITPFAYSVLKAGSTLASEWNFGTDNWNATGMTVAHVNILTLPNRPQVA